MSATVLVTGSRGFFGRRVAAALRSHGFNVAAPVRPQFDLSDAASVDQMFSATRPEIVVHAAAYYGGLGICIAEPAQIFHRNVVMAVHLLNSAARYGVQRFMAIGSACAYGGHIAGDMRECDFWAGPLHPSVEAYGFTKKLLQVGLHAYGKQYGIQGQLPLVTNLYGEHDVFGEYRSHVAAALIKRFADAVQSGAKQVVCWGTGSPVREFIYVGDAAEAVVRLLKTNHFDPLNIGTGVGTSIKELAELIARCMEFTGDIIWDGSKPDGVDRKVLDISRMKDVLDWTPPTALAEGLKRTIRWYLANKETADARP
jgi:nucleoside-diphosphate-sugar epimerase